MLSIRAYIIISTDGEILLFFAVLTSLATRHIWPGSHGETPRPLFKGFEQVCSIVAYYSPVTTSWVQVFFMKEKRILTRKCGSIRNSSLAPDNWQTGKCRCYVIYCMVWCLISHTERKWDRIKTVCVYTIIIIIIHNLAFPIVNFLIKTIFLTGSLIKKIPRGWYCCHWKTMKSLLLERFY